MAHDGAGTGVLLIGALIGALGKERILRFGCGCGPKVAPSCDAYGWRYERAAGVAVSLVVSRSAGGQVVFEAHRELAWRWSSAR